MMSIGTYSKESSQQAAVEADHFLLGYVIVVHVCGQGHPELHGDVQHQLINMATKQMRSLLIFQQFINLKTKSYVTNRFSFIKDTGLYTVRSTL